MSKEKFLNLKDNLISRGLLADDIESLYSYLENKKGKIVFPERLAYKFKVSYLQSQGILSFLSNANITKPFFRLEYEEFTSQYLDYEKITDIPSELELDEYFIEKPFDYIQILYKVSMF